MQIQMIISGVGGQGVLLATRIFSVMALNEGYPLIGSETHGMSQRGGSVITHLKIGHYDSPLVRKGGADILFCLEKNEVYRGLSFLKQGSDGGKGGICFVNAPDPHYMDQAIKAYLEQKGIEMYIFEADRIAREMGALRSANIALIGFTCAHPRLPLDPAKIRTAIETTVPPQFQRVSLRIFDRGLVEGRNRLEGQPGRRRDPLRSSAPG
jgi:indolepyruvate ferredoxin oxidoreductase beta subunit